MEELFTILLVDDDPHVLSMLEDLFEEDYKIISARSGMEAVEKVRSNPGVAAVVLDIKMAGMDGIKAMEEIRRIQPEARIILHTAYPGEYDEAEIDRDEKPFEYIQKGKSIQRLIRSVRNAVETYRLSTDQQLMCRLAESRYGIIGRSTAMQKIVRQVHQVAAGNGRVSIIGETGTGKGLVAHAIHLASQRCDKPLAILGVSHKKHGLVEAELFGAVRGAYTGAVTDRMGLFEYANEGTLFLDEIGDLDLDIQSKLLQVLESGEYSRLGSPITCRTDIRVICASQLPLESLMRKGNLRADLFYRIKGVTIEMPPLRDRREDIPALVAYFTSQFTVERGLAPKKFDDAAVNTLIAHDWPGNVRELADAVESLIVLSDSDIIFADDVKRFLKQPSSDATPTTLSARLKDMERTLIVQALQESGCNVAGAARLLGIDRANLHKKIKAHDIDVAGMSG